MEPELWSKSPFSIFNNEFKSDMTLFYLVEHNPTTVRHNCISVENGIKTMEPELSH